MLRLFRNLGLRHLFTASNSKNVIFRGSEIMRRFTWWMEAEIWIESRIEPCSSFFCFVFFTSQSRPGLLHRTSYHGEAKYCIAVWENRYTSIIIIIIIIISLCSVSGTCLLPSGKRHDVASTLMRRCLNVARSLGIDIQFYYTTVLPRQKKQ